MSEIATQEGPSLTRKSLAKDLRHETDRFVRKFGKKKPWRRETEQPKVATEPSQVSTEQPGDGAKSPEMFRPAPQEPRIVVKGLDDAPATGTNAPEGEKQPQYQFEALVEFINANNEKLGETLGPIQRDKKGMIKPEYVQKVIQAFHDNPEILDKVRAHLKAGGGEGAVLAERFLPEKPTATTENGDVSLTMAEKKEVKMLERSLQAYIHDTDNPELAYRAGQLLREAGDPRLMAKVRMLKHYKSLSMMAAAVLFLLFGAAAMQYGVAKMFAGLKGKGH